MPLLTKTPPQKRVNQRASPRRNKPGAGRPRKFTDNELINLAAVAAENDLDRNWVARSLRTTQECVYLHCRRLGIELPNVRKIEYRERAMKIWNEFVGKRTVHQLAKRFRTKTPVIRSALWYVVNKKIRPHAGKATPRRMNEIKLFKTLQEYKPQHLTASDLKTMTGIPERTCEIYLKRYDTATWR